ncbi:DUF3306 domain-containing protein [Thauera chlorobenzoica]|uniref:Uncharacterized protein n=1 Tax=Thauera chlorobenzoica TaxID=96773 RepID=A0A1H5W339_9RHOO|nr:DUF3306 domain-containing protein [Thauera chlorobenzoica]APR03354.1 hypothetical protein Tchl_0483 [Thauera chlorobenzoica]SEF93860.1 Protein of unknown function [Thauera chlorobenzoica]
MSAGGFLSRWSRRKLAAVAAGASSDAPPGAAAAAPPAAAAECAADAGACVADCAGGAPADERADNPLPPLEELSLASDFSAFLKEEVGEALRRQALRKLFSDPHFNRMDGLDIYIGDYSQPDPIAPEAMAKLRHAREWLRANEAPAIALQGASPARAQPVLPGDEHAAAALASPGAEREAGAAADAAAPQPDGEGEGSTAPPFPAGDAFRAGQNGP